MATVLVVSGLPATGKTTLARALAERLKLPLVSKDDFKEIPFDTLGSNERLGTQSLGVASVTLLYRALENNLQAGVSTIVESNFRPESDGAKLRALAHKHDSDLIQIHCRCDGGMLVERFVGRIGSSERHPGHVESRETDRRYLSDGPSNRLDLPGETIEIDTTDFARVDFDEIATRLRTLMTKG